MKILVTIPFTEVQKEKIRMAAGDKEISVVHADAVTEEMMVDTDILMGNLPIPLIQKAAGLKWLQLNSAGADAFCRPGVLSEETVLTNASGAYDISVSEGMVAATFALFKKLYPYHDNQKQHLWKDEGMVQSAYGACIVVLGLGKIGLSYAQKMKVWLKCVRWISWKSVSEGQTWWYRSFRVQKKLLILWEKSSFL